MKYALIFCLALLTGCSSVMNQPEYKLPSQLTDEEIHTLDCNQYGVCSALYINYNRPKTLKVAVSGEYHPITGATVWIDDQPYPLAATIEYTRSGPTQSGNRISMRTFRSDKPLKELLINATQVTMETNLKSFSFNTVMKDEGFVHKEWKALLAGFD